ncbi:MAG: deoxyribonuclease V [Planctomycetes bacterium]|nr:deoxyribonuclease V [Planctomycetota bacterium]
MSMAEKPKIWNIDVKEAVEQQKMMALKVRQDSLGRPIQVVAGADCSFSKDGQYCIAAVIALSWPDLQPLTSSQAVNKVEFPYIPGLLSFREAPAVISAVKKLKIVPDVLIIDGQGRAHPRRFGLACHVGLELDIPTIGCAKSRLIGSHRTPAADKGSRCRLLDDSEIIGTVLRSRQAVKCLYVSVGHLIELDQAVDTVLKCCRRYRICEPIRLAHQMVTKLRLKLATETIK